MPKESLLAGFLERVGEVEPMRVRGKIREVTGIVIRASLPDAAVGEMVRIHAKSGAKDAEIVGFKDDQAVLMPFGDTVGVGAGDEVESLGRPFTIRCGPHLIGRVLNGMGVPIDSGPPLDPQELQDWAVDRPAPHPLKRPRVTQPLAVGVRAIDGLLTLGRGQRVGLFAGSGVGKSSLMGQIARGSEADINVICLIGERGREVRDFVEGVLGPRGLARSVVVCATSDAPSLVRLKSAFTATAIAEYFRDRGANVLLMMDSVTRFARAQREVGLAAGEPPARQGYPPSVFSTLPRLLERAGNSELGSVTALYTVLVAGGDMDEPIADEVRGILDGHIILSRKLASRNHWPAIDILPSLSRVMGDVVDTEHRRVAGEFRRMLSTYESRRDLIALGAYEYGSDEATDIAIDSIEAMEAFLMQAQDETTSLDEGLAMMMDAML